jgi:hypothetical protein
MRIAGLTARQTHETKTALFYQKFILQHLAHSRKNVQFVGKICHNSTFFCVLASLNEAFLKEFGASRLFSIK